MQELANMSDALIRKRRETLAYKRSFFVRMVSDPKIYNPAIVKSTSTQQRPVERERQMSQTSASATTLLSLFYDKIRVC